MRLVHTSAFSMQGSVYGWKWINLGNYFVNWHAVPSCKNVSHLEAMKKADETDIAYKKKKCLFQ